MQRVSNRYSDVHKMPFRGEDPQTVGELRSVAKAFVELQDSRHTADHDNGRHWTRSEAIEEFLRAGAAIDAWKIFVTPTSRKNILCRSSSANATDYGTATGNVVALAFAASLPPGYALERDRRLELGS